MRYRPSRVLQGGVGLLAVGFSHGIFELLQLPDLTTVHTLSIGRCAGAGRGGARTQGRRQVIPHALLMCGGPLHGAASPLPAWQVLQHRCSALINAGP